MFAKKLRILICTALIFNSTPTAVHAYPATGITGISHKAHKYKVIAGVNKVLVDVVSKEIKRAKEDAAKPKEMKFEHKGYTTDGVRLRKEPSTDAEILDTFYINTPIEYNDSKGGWSLVKVDGVIGYISSQYISSKRTEIKKPTTPAATSNYSWSGSKLNSQIGTVNGPSGKETYYNMPMGGVIQIMNRHGYTMADYAVRPDGVKTLGGYVMVAADLDVHPRGSRVPTSLGMGLVCDTGTFTQTNHYQLDIATTW